jgi:hypothetical protein
VFGQESFFELDFNRRPLEVVKVSKNTNFSIGQEIPTSEIAATIADSIGELMYYTNGISIYDQNYDPLPGGDSFFSDLDMLSSNEGAVFFPYPENEDLTILLYLTELQDPGLYPADLITSRSTLSYVLIDNRLNGGLGDIISEPVDIGDFYAEGFAIVPGVCGDNWLMVRKRTTNEIHTYKINEEGFSADPIISPVIQADRYLLSRQQWDRITDIGTIHYTQQNTIVMSSVSGVIERYDFDPSTGQLSNPQVIEHLEFRELNGRAKGFEVYIGTLVSKSGKYLFVKELGGVRTTLEIVNIYQYDITLPTGTAIKNSKKLIGTFNSHGTGDDLAHHPYSDNEIIVAKGKNPSLGLIRCDPTIDSCWYIDNYIDLPFSARNGLVLNHDVTIGTSLGQNRDIFVRRDTSICIGETISLIPNVSQFDSVLWSSGSKESSIAVSDKGVYSIIAYSNGCSFVDSIEIQEDDRFAEFDLGEDRVLCAGETLSIGFQGAESLDFSWSTGESTTVIEVSLSGKYGLEIFDGTCFFRDTISIDFIDNNDSFLPSDTTICSGETVTVDLSDFDNIIWSDGSTNLTRQFSESGIFFAELSGASGCLLIDSFEIRTTTVPSDLLFDDSLTICLTDTIILSIDNNLNNVLWSDGSSTSSVAITEAGTYTVTADLNECVVSDMITLVEPASVIDLISQDSLFLCPDDSIMIGLSVSAEDILWSSGSQQNNIAVTLPGTYSVRATIQGCEILDSILVRDVTSNLELIAEDSLALCLGDQIILALTKDVTFDNIVWSDGTIGKSITVTTSGIYSVTGSIGGCALSDTIIIYSPESTDLIMTDATSICPDDTVRLSIDPTLEFVLWFDGTEGSEVSIFETGIYDVIGVRDDCIISDTINIGLSDNCSTLSIPSDECNVYVPNALYPQSNLGNGLFAPISSCNLLDYSLEIFDRWGGKIYSSNNPAEGWDGRDVNLGIYLYNLSYSYDGLDKRITKSGTITMIQ